MLNWLCHSQRTDRSWQYSCDGLWTGWPGGLYGKQPTLSAATKIASFHCARIVNVLGTEFNHQQAGDERCDTTAHCGPYAIQQQAGTCISATHDWLARGNNAYELKNYEQALAAYKLARKQDTTSIEAWSGKG